MREREYVREREREKQGESERGADSGRHGPLAGALRDGDVAELEERNDFLGCRV